MIAENNARQLIASMETLGLVASFLVREQPFADFRAVTLVRALQHQLSGKDHVCIIEDEKLVAYCGWLPVTRETGERWMRDEAGLVPVPRETSDAIACTIVSITERRHLRPLIRAARALNPNKLVYFKRDKGPERSRKTTLRNVAFDRR